MNILSLNKAAKRALGCKQKFHRTYLNVFHIFHVYLPSCIFISITHNYVITFLPISSSSRDTEREIERENKKLSYPQRKCASNVAILYGADGISI